ncbi:MAG: helix-turn-helix domain-containing protein [Lachnospiraceae bacterium]|nr:helix-turn-helix domain-containing protein [Lachnospiraceae bacterium]
MKKKNGNNDNTNVFGERLRQLRTQDLHLSQKEFSDIIGIPQSTLSSYESGKIKPTIDVVISISQTFSVSIDWLCGRETTVKVNSLGALMECFFEIFEVEDIELKADIDNTFEEDAAGNPVFHDNYAKLTFLPHYFEATGDKSIMGEELVDVIEQAYSITESYKKYEKTKANYERERDFWIDYYKDIPLKKISREGLTEKDLEKKRLEYWKKRIAESESGKI